MNDEYLLASLRMAAGVDPVPGHVSADARATLALRLPGGVVAEPVPVDPAAGARSDGEPRMRRFTADGLTIDLETAVVDGRVEVAGQLSPAPGPDATVEIRTPHISKVRVLSDSGQFAVAGLPCGWVSVVCRRPDRAPVTTRWIHIRE